MRDEKEERKKQACTLYMHLCKALQAAILHSHLMVGESFTGTAAKAIERSLQNNVNL